MQPPQLSIFLAVNIVVLSPPVNPLTVNRVFSVSAWLNLCIVWYRRKQDRVKDHRCSLTAWLTCVLKLIQWILQTPQQSLVCHVSNTSCKCHQSLSTCCSHFFSSYLFSRPVLHCALMASFTAQVGFSRMAGWQDGEGLSDNSMTMFWTCSFNVTTAVSLTWRVTAAWILHPVDGRLVAERSTHEITVVYASIIF
jgi:hypothetical protein